MSQTATNSQLAALVSRANTGEPLTSEEFVQFRGRNLTYFRSFENVHYQYRQGLYDQIEYAAQEEAWRAFAARRQLLVEIRRSYRHTISPECRAEFDGLLTKPC